MKSSRSESHDPLQELELQIARRADRLALSSPLRTGLNLHCWTEAEREIFGVMLASPFLVPAAEAASGSVDSRAAYAEKSQLADAC